MERLVYYLPLVVTVALINLFTVYVITFVRLYKNSQGIGHMFRVFCEFSKKYIATSIETSCWPVEKVNFTIFVINMAIFV